MVQYRAVWQCLGDFFLACLLSFQMQRLSGRMRHCCSVEQAVMAVTTAVAVWQVGPDKVEAKEITSWTVVLSLMSQRDHSNLHQQTYTINKAQILLAAVELFTLVP